MAKYKIVVGEDVERGDPLAWDTRRRGLYRGSMTPQAVALESARAGNECLVESDEVVLPPKTAIDRLREAL